MQTFENYTVAEKPGNPKYVTMPGRLGLPCWRSGTIGPYAFHAKVHCDRSENRLCGGSISDFSLTDSRTGRIVYRHFSFGKSTLALDTPEKEFAVNAIVRYYWDGVSEQAVVVDSDGIIIAGHTRYRAALKLGLQKIPVHVAVDLTPEQIRAYRIADNKTAELAEWDMEILPIELGELRDTGFDMELVSVNINLERLINDSKSKKFYSIHERQASRLLPSSQCPA